jgi:ferrochelatase
MLDTPIDSVLLIGFGGPTAPEEIRPFLRRVVAGRGVPDERLDEVERHYLEVGGRSPYNEQTERLRVALEAWLAARGRPLPAYTGMRSWHPFLADTFQRMRADGRRHAAGAILATHRSEASQERSLEAISRAAAEGGGEGPAIDLLPPWFDHPRFAEAVAARVEQTVPFRRGAWPASVPVVFTAHSIPVRMADASSYVSEVRRSCERAAAVLGVADWEVAYQSRSGEARTPWLEPDVNDVLRRRAGEGCREVVLHAIGFLSDHVEVLFDLDVEARRTAEACGIALRRTPCVGDHPQFVTLLGELILEVSGGAA